MTRRNTRASAHEAPGALLQFARVELLAAVGRAEETIWLASPFLSRPIAKRLVESANRSKAPEKRLLTALNPMSVRAGALDPAGLQLLRSAGFVIATISNLHAKVAIIDDQWGLVGSGNLTNAGVGPGGPAAHKARANFELGVVLDSDQIARATRILGRWWQLATEVTPQLLAAYDALPRFRRAQGHPIDQGPELLPPSNDWVENFFAEDASAASSRRYWMKAAYYRRGQDEDGWWRRGWISDRRRAPYRAGDLIVLYLGGDGSPQCCPSVLKVLAEAVEDSDFVQTHGRGAEDRKYPYVTRTECLFDIPIGQAPRPEAFNIDPRSTQPGYRGLSHQQFEAAVRAMTSA